MKYFLALAFFCASSALFAQKDYWQQKVEYQMDIDFDVNSHQYSGDQLLTYYNNSPDTLYRVFYHLYFNAFQPNSMMDTQSRTIEDPDPRIGTRLIDLKPSEQGYLHVDELMRNGKPLKYSENGTILEVVLNKPILPGKKAKFKMKFKGQVPVQVRRSGRYGKEGVAYSMAQWYPKMSEYDYMGWHADPYIAREFHGVWGDFEVNIRIDKEFTIGGTGVLTNPEEIGHGYTDEEIVPKADNSGKLTWKFKADNVHDFVWAADDEYVHTKLKMEEGPELHFFYKTDKDLQKNWEELPEYTVRIFKIASRQFGKYPWPQYSVIQGGDGGMEYPMATLITGRRSLGSLVGVTVHEVMHAWYQSALATNEGLYPWMDEGFCTYSSNRVMIELFEKDEDPRIGRFYDSYINLALSGKEEPLSTMADHFQTNYAYSAASYSKGAVYVAQLSYVLGDSIMRSGLKKYFQKWSFKHPDPVKFIRVMEKESGIHLKWYNYYMINSLAHIDYAINQVQSGTESTTVSLERKGSFPMPVDVYVYYRNGETEVLNIPLRVMHGSKTEDLESDFTVLEDWPWTHPTYSLNIDRPLSDIEKIEIDSSMRMADVDRSNNVIEIEPGTEIIISN